MASELSTLYAELERKVQVKSQELVRSERLASVGFLAAGVAHEINNPLNIMSGYAEMARGWLQSADHHGEVEQVRDALDIIRQEAFRCKDITDKLLSLATGETQRSQVSLPRLAGEMAAMLRGLRKYQDRSIIVQAEEAAHAPVRASAAEIKQVLLNLMVNALEAVPSGSGEVRVDCRRAAGMVEVAVSDNGEGMTPEVRERVFEPFFSARRSRAAQHRSRGVGLGLSISHAIITNHGGKITAESGGPGLGSRFSIELPVATRAAHAKPEVAVHAT
jgi:signal transduction histidine kinase